MTVRIYLCLLLIFAISSFSFGQQITTTSNKKSSSTNTPDVVKSVEWNKIIHDFKNITQGSPVTASFEFTNKTEVPIIISSVSTSCGCTATDYTKEPALPDKKSSIEVTFDAAKVGYFLKTITVNANTPEKTYYLQIRGTVIAKD